jgi:DNA-binding NarL/FixJ family response regulator
VIRVLIADDQALVRGAFRMMLESEPDIEVLAEAENGRDAVQEARARKPDVVLMDVRMPGVDGIEATRQLLAGGAGPRVLMLTTFDLDEYVYEAMRAGASGFMLKNVPPDQLAAAVRTIAAGEALLAPTITRRLIEQFVQRPRPGGEMLELAALTEREVDILRHVARGLSNAEIADSLFVSAATVKTHVNRVLTKLGIRDRTQATVLAYEIGLVVPGAENPPET